MSKAIKNLEKNRKREGGHETRLFIVLKQKKINILFYIKLYVYSMQV